jgi:TRAP-type C4-dicarboxylate transport system permease small subunit
MNLDKLVDRGIPILSGVLLVEIVGVTFLQIVLREFFNFSMNWSDEITCLCMTWLTLIGSIWVTKNDKHLNTGLKLHRKLKKRQICLIDCILALVIVSIAAVVAYQSAVFSFSAMHMDFLSMPGLKMGWAFIALPIFMLAVCYYYTKSFLKNLVLVFKKDSNSTH